MPRIRGGAVEPRGADKGEAEAETREHQSPDRRIRRRGEAQSRRRPAYASDWGQTTRGERTADEEEAVAWERHESREREERPRGEWIRFRFWGRRGGMAVAARVTICYRVVTGPTPLSCQASAFTAGRHVCPSTTLYACRAEPCSCRAFTVPGRVLSDRPTRLDNYTFM
jgi:hypothetical protein